MSRMLFLLTFLLAGTIGFIATTRVLYAQTEGISIISQSTSLAEVLARQEVGPAWPFNPIKYAIREIVGAGVDPNTVSLLLLLPVIASLIAGTRHLIGVRGFGIFLPAALSIVFLSTGPIVGIGLFVIITLVSVLLRSFLKALKIKLQYLPRMALMLLLVSISVLMVLLAAIFIGAPDVTSISIFPILFLVLLTEDFTRVQLGKSARTALNLTTETLILALLSYVFLTLRPIQEFAILHPELLLGSVAVFDWILGKYVGLRLLEFWRFRKLITS